MDCRMSGHQTHKLVHTARYSRSCIRILRGSSRLLDTQHYNSSRWENRDLDLGRKRNLPVWLNAVKKACIIWLEKRFSHPVRVNIINFHLLWAQCIGTITTLSKFRALESCWQNVWEPRFKKIFELRLKKIASTRELTIIVYCRIFLENIDLLSIWLQS